MLRIFGLLAGFGLMLLFIKGALFFLPLLAIVFFFRLVIGGFGPYRYRRAHAFGRGPQHRFHRYAERCDGCYGYEAQATPEQPRAATGPTVRL